MRQYRMPRWDLSQPGRLARSNMRAIEAQSSAFNSAIQSGLRLASAVVDVQKTLDKRRTERELLDFNIETATALQEWETEHADKAFYSAEEVRNTLGDSAPVDLTEQYVTETNDVGERDRSDIPAYEVRPEMFRQFIETSLPVWGAKISDERKREEVLTRHRVWAEKKYTEMYKAAEAEQREQLYENLKYDIGYLQDRQKYDMAKEAVKSVSFLSNRQKKNHIHNIELRQETDTYEKLVTEKDLPGIRDALRAIRQDYDTYRKGGGRLNQEDRASYAKYLQAAANRIQKEFSIGVTNRQTFVRKQVRSELSDIEDGFMPPPEIISQYRQLLSEFGTPEDAFLLKQLDEAYEIGSVVQDIMTSNDTQSEVYIDQAVKHTDVANKAAFRNTLLNALERKQAALNSDAVAFIKKWHTNYPSFDPSNLEQSFAIAKQIGIDVQNTYGIKPQYLSKGEWSRFERVFEDASIDDKLGILATARRQLEDDAAAFFQEGMRKEADLVGIVGGVTLHNINGARHALLGRELLKDKTIDLSKISDTLTMDIRKEISNVYADPSLAKDKIKAIRYIYANLTWREHGAAPHEQLDSDILDTAIQYVMPARIDVHGSTVVAPGPNITSKMFENKIDNIHATHFEREGGFVNWSPRQVTKGLRSGDIQLSSLGEGKYVLLYEGFPIQAKKTEQPYVLDYYSDFYTVNEAKADYKLANPQAEEIEWSRQVSARKLKKERPIVNIFSNK